MVISLERGADLHTAQLMPLPLTVSCFSKIQIGLTFWYRLTRVVPDKGPFSGCVCVCVLIVYHAIFTICHFFNNYLLLNGLFQINLCYLVHTQFSCCVYSGGVPLGKVACVLRTRYPSHQQYQSIGDNTFLPSLTTS